VSKVVAAHGNEGFNQAPVGESRIYGLSMHHGSTQWEAAETAVYRHEQWFLRHVQRHDTLRGITYSVECIAWHSACQSSHAVQGFACGQAWTVESLHPFWRSFQGPVRRRLSYRRRVRTSGERGDESAETRQLWPCVDGGPM